jgi:tRNA A64-2'-O-ribosylphosphate transferase
MFARLSNTQPRFSTTTPPRHHGLPHHSSPPMPLPTASELIFSDQANHNFSKTLGELKRSTFSIQNRLRSIQHDAAFAQQVAEAYGRPLIANERCGSWYINPETKGGSAYFKSTDGHTGVWKFSSRRLNLHLLELIGKHDGCVAPFER